ncbi:MAG: hypothetical protein BAJALOKI2v1_520022 [Promethearchaeota archaeon]|nr:MAG: hypothetical protein BAJALOKI2v1_520022 [Candidatus Lokiarchaeota archaeon]
MAENNVKKTWFEILKINEKLAQKEDSWSLEKKIKIPLTPISVNAEVLHYLFEFLYPEFINDQQNLLDLIISNEDSQILKVYLYPTDKPGIFKEVKKINPKDLKLKDIDLDDLEPVYDKIQDYLMKKYDLRVGNVRIFKEEALDLLNQYISEIKNEPFHEVCIKAFIVFKKIFKKELFWIIPEPNIYSFLQGLFEFFSNINLDGSFHTIFNLFPEFNIAIYLDSPQTPLIVKLRNDKLNPRISNIYIDINHPKEHALIYDDYEKNELLEEIKVRLESERVYYLNQQDVVEIFHDLFEMKIPVEEGSLRLFLQKLIFAFRRFEINWFQEPRPVIYNFLIRFLLRLIGFHLNLKKISHWEIPNFLFNSWKRNFGLKERLLILFTQIDESKKERSDENKLGTSLTGALSVYIENGVIQSIQSVEIDNLRQISDKESILKRIYGTYFSKKTPFSGVLKIDKYLLRLFLEIFVFNVSRINIFRMRKFIKKLKKRQYFDIYPTKPFIETIRGKRSFSLMRTLLPIFIDRHEF